MGWKPIGLVKYDLANAREKKSKASLSEAKTPQEVVLLKLGQIKYARVKSAAGHRASPSEPHEIAETQCFDSKIEKYSPAQIQNSQNT